MKHQTPTGKVPEPYYPPNAFPGHQYPVCPDCAVAYMSERLYEQHYKSKHVPTGSEAVKELNNIKDGKDE